jgi:glycosyltransferase involved in cell wall biosynthesis
MAKPESNDFGESGLPVVMFVATTPFAVNAFLANHIAVLSEHYRIILCTNLDAYSLLPSLISRVAVRHIPFSRKISLGTDLKSVLQLVAAIHQVRPIVVHSITPKAGLLAMLAGLITGVSKRWHTFTGQVWATKKGFARSFLKSVDRLIVLLASQVFADSASQCRLLRDEGVVRDGQIGILGPGSIAGVDLNRFCPDAIDREQLRRQMGTDVNSCVFLFVGRLSKDKGVFDLVGAFMELATALRDIELWVVGPDEEGLLLSLQEAAVSCGAPIRWLGATTTPEHFMAAADILLLPSYREGFGSVIIEGAACAIPAIAYRIDGVIDAVADGSSGLLVEVGQPTAFASAMKLLVLDRALRLRLGHKAHERAVRDFSSENVTKAWLDFYRSQITFVDQSEYATRRCK